MRHKKFMGIDDAPLGVLIYSSEGWPLGLIDRHFCMNGDKPADVVRVLDDGKTKYHYVRRHKYLEVKRSGPIYILVD